MGHRLAPEYATSLDIDFSKHTDNIHRTGCQGVQPVMKDLAAEYRDQLLVLFAMSGKTTSPQPTTR